MLEDLLSIGEGLAIIGGTVVAVTTLVVMRIEARKDRDLQMILRLSDSFRERWESRWEQNLERAERREDPAAAVHVRHMLNWLDWFGRMIRSRTFSREELIFDTYGFAFRRIIDAGADIIHADTKTHGTDYWRGVLFVKSRLFAAPPGERGASEFRSSARWLRWLRPMAATATTARKQAAERETRESSDRWMP